MLEEYSGKYFFVQIVRTNNDVASSMLGYDTLRAAEIKFHDEVSYGLKLDDIILAHYMVMNEYGIVIDNLERTIDNQPPVEPTL